MTAPATPPLADLIAEMRRSALAALAISSRWEVNPADILRLLLAVDRAEEMARALEAMLEASGCLRGNPATDNESEASARRALAAWRAAGEGEGR